MGWAVRWWVWRLASKLMGRTVTRRMGASRRVVGWSGVTVVVGGAARTWARNASSGRMLRWSSAGVVVVGTLQAAGGGWRSSGVEVMHRTVEQAAGGRRDRSRVILMVRTVDSTLLSTSRLGLRQVAGQAARGGVLLCWDGPWNATDSGGRGGVGGHCLGLLDQ